MTRDLEQELKGLGKELRSLRDTTAEHSKSAAISAAVTAFDNESSSESESAIWADLLQGVFSRRVLVPVMIILFAITFVFKNPQQPSTLPSANFAELDVDEEANLALAYAELQTTFEISDEDLEYGDFLIPDEEYSSLVLDLSDIDEMEDNYDEEDIEDILEYL